MMSETEAYAALAAIVRTQLLNEKTALLERIRVIDRLNEIHRFNLAQYSPLANKSFVRQPEVGTIDLSPTSHVRATVEQKDAWKCFSVDSEWRGYITREPGDVWSGRSVAELIEQAAADRKIGSPE